MRNRQAYAAHAGFVEPARARASLWLFAAGLILAVITYLTSSQFYAVAFGIACSSAGVVADLTAGDTPLSMYFLLSSLGFMALGVGVSTRLLHKRPFSSLIGAIPQAIADFWSVSVVVLAIGAVLFILPPWDMGAGLVQNMPLGRWLLLLVPSLFFILIQVASEEIVFRGYIQQQLAARFRSQLVWMALPSALFALGHYLPDAAGQNALLIAVWAGVFGFLMADLTARSGTLGPAIAVHFWNNVSAMMVISLPDEISGLALYLTPFGMADTAVLRSWLVVDFAMMLVMWLAARLAIRR